MFASVNFFEEIPFFSSSKQDVNSVQQISPMPLVETFVYPTRNIASTSPNNSNPSHKPNSPRPSSPLITSQRRTPMTGPIPHSESSTSSPSPSMFHTTSLDNEDSNWHIHSKRYSLYTQCSSYLQFSKLSLFVPFLLFFYLLCIFHYHS